MISPKKQSKRGARTRDFADRVERSTTEPKTNRNVGFEPGTSLTESSALPLSQKRGSKIKSPGWDDGIPSPEKNTLHTHGNPKNTDTKMFNEGKILPKMMETPPFLGISSLPGDGASRPRKGTFRRPPLVNFGCGAPSFASDTEGCRLARARRAR